MSELQFTKARRYLELLGLQHGCTKDEIAQAVKRQQSKWHPDRHTDPCAKLLAEQKVLDKLYRASPRAGAGRPPRPPPVRPSIPSTHPCATLPRGSSDTDLTVF